MNVQAHAFVLSYELIIMNVDGTIAKRNSNALLPEASDFFGWLNGVHREGQAIPVVALATNQGSVGCRLAMIESGWGNPKNLPDMEMVNARLRAIRDAIPISVDMYVSYAWRSRLGVWSPTPIEYAGAPEWSRYWRKPQPGMVLAAMKKAVVTLPSKVLVVGADKDRSAALAARTDFMESCRFYESVGIDTAVPVGV